MQSYPQINQNSKKNWYIIGGVIVGIVILIIAITIPLAAKKKSNFLSIETPTEIISTSLTQNKNGRYNYNITQGKKTFDIPSQQQEYYDQDQDQSINKFNKTNVAGMGTLGPETGLGPDFNKTESFADLGGEMFNDLATSDNFVGIVQTSNLENNDYLQKINLYKQETSLNALPPADVNYIENQNKFAQANIDANHEINATSTNAIIMGNANVMSPQSRKTYINTDRGPGLQQIEPQFAMDLQKEMAIKEVNGPIDSPMIPEQTQTIVTPITKEPVVQNDVQKVILAQELQGDKLVESTVNPEVIAKGVQAQVQESFKDKAGAGAPDQQKIDGITQIITKIILNKYSGSSDGINCKEILGIPWDQKFSDTSIDNLCLSAPRKVSDGFKGQIVFGGSKYSFSVDAIKKEMQSLRTKCYPAGALVKDLLKPYGQFNRNVLEYKTQSIPKYIIQRDIKIIENIKIQQIESQKDALLTDMQFVQNIILVNLQLVDTIQKAIGNFKATTRMDPVQNVVTGQLKQSGVIEKKVEAVEKVPIPGVVPSAQKIESYTSGQIRTMQSLANNNGYYQKVINKAQNKRAENYQPKSSGIGIGKVVKLTQTYQVPVNQFSNGNLPVKSANRNGKYQKQETFTNFK